MFWRQFETTRTRHQRRSSERGAVFLLQSYLTVFWFVVLTTAMLTRSSMELRHSQVALEEHQAFWQAEAGLDETLYGIKTNPPALAANECTEPTDQLLSLSVGEGYAYTYQVCLNENGQYSVISTGEGNTSAIEELSTTVAIPNDNLRFRQAVLAIDQMVTRQATFGAVSSVLTTLGGGTTLVLPSTTTLNRQAHLVALAKNPDGAAVKLSERSYVKGNVVIPPGLTSTSGLVIEEDSSLTNEQGTSEASVLEDRIVLPEPVAVPSDAVNLGALELKGTTRCLEPGTYKTTSLVMSKEGGVEPVLCTKGAVNLYVTGTVTQSSGRLYGQPDTTSSTPMNRYSPKHLRIFVTGEQEVKFGASITAAVVYAPRAHVIIGKKQVFMGSVIAKKASIGGTGEGNRTYFLYDQALANERFSVNTGTRQVTVQAQQAVPQASVSHFAAGTVPFRVIDGFDPSHRIVAPPAGGGHSFSAQSATPTTAPKTELSAAEKLAAYLKELLKKAAAAISAYLRDHDD